MTNLKNIKIVPKQDQMILAQNYYTSRDGTKTHVNNNVVVIGASGCGKTRGIVKPNIMQANTNFVISDPKGNLSREYREFLEGRGYKVVVMDFIHPEKSLHYNPLTRCLTTTDVQKLAYTLTYELEQAESTGFEVNRKDPFWDEATQSLFAAVIGYLLETDDVPEAEKNLIKVADVIRLAGCEQDYNHANASIKAFFNQATRNHLTQLDFLMYDHDLKMKAKGQESWAVRRYRDLLTAPEKTFATIMISTLNKISRFDTLELREMMKCNDLDFTSLGREKTALFVIVSDTDRTNDALVNLFYSQVMDVLCRYADEQPDSRLPMDVQFILDDFATNARIVNFDNIISNIRSRGISTMIMLQSEAQLEVKYGMNAKIIIDNCNTYIYMGGMDPDNAEKAGKRVGKSTNTMLNLGLNQCYVCRRGEDPKLCDNIDLEWLEEVHKQDLLIDEELDKPAV